MADILKHEAMFLEAAVNVAQERFSETSRTQGEAAGIRADWHDNAAYDEAVRMTAKAAGLLTEIKSMLTNSNVVEYPNAKDTRIALGSLVLAEDSFGSLPFIMVSQRLVGRKLYNQAWERDHRDDELTIVTRDSTLGMAAYMASSGDTITYEQPNGRKQKTLINAVNQEWMAVCFSGLTRARLLESPHLLF